MEKIDLELPLDTIMTIHLDNKINTLESLRKEGLLNSDIEEYVHQDFDFIKRLCGYQCYDEGDYVSYYLDRLYFGTS